MHYLFAREIDVLSYTVHQGDEPIRDTQAPGTDVPLTFSRTALTSRETMAASASNGGHPANGDGDGGSDDGRPQNGDAREGMKFGTGISSYDVYAAGTPAAAGSGEYVDSLPTDEEERRMEGMGLGAPTAGASDRDARNRAREEVEMIDEGRSGAPRLHPSTLAARAAGPPEDGGGEEEDPFANATGGSGLVNTRISDRESDYQKRRTVRTLREDGMSFRDAMRSAQMDKERDELLRAARRDLLDDEGEMKVGAEGTGAGGAPPPDSHPLRIRIRVRRGGRGGGGRGGGKVQEEEAAVGCRPRDGGPGPGPGPAPGPGRDGWGVRRQR